MSTFDCTWDEFRGHASSFFKHTKDVATTVDEAENAFKCLSLHFLALDPDHARHNDSVITLELASRRLFEIEARYGT